MQAIQDKCFKVGIPLRTRHREVAPNQFEFAPLFGSVVSQTDQNLVVMQARRWLGCLARMRHVPHAFAACCTHTTQIIEETAAKYGLAALMQEKPFQGINGSGKHNNWSISTAEGAQLLNPAQLFAKTGARRARVRAASLMCAWARPRRRVLAAMSRVLRALTLPPCLLPAVSAQATPTSSPLSWLRWCPAWTSTAT
jgi:hypothetical protein